jgi:hypothetical protein
MIPRACSNSTINLSFNLNGFSMKTIFQYSITSLLLHHRVKHYETKPTGCSPYSSRAFQWYQERNRRCHGLGDLKGTTKQNKQTITFLDR